MKEYYNMIFKRKSMRKFDNKLFVSKSELNQIREKLNQLIPLDENIKTHFEIVKKEETTCKRGEYCLLMYSESKDQYLLNAGYLLEQVDLFLASVNIGGCWYGFGKVKEKQKKGLDFIIMLAFGKSQLTDFRKDMFKSRRKPKETVWQGTFDENVVNIVRYAPSSCNMQPWRVFSNDKHINIYRTTNVTSIMPISKRFYYNSIDMGIFLCFLEIILKHENYEFKRFIYKTEKNIDETLIQVASYIIL